MADPFRAEDRERVQALSPGERIRLALALGARDLEAFRAAQRHPCSPAEAGRLLERQRQVGRRASRCLTELIG